MKTEPSPDSSAPERRAQSAEIFEEFADGEIDRWHGTFYVALNYGDDEIDDPSEGDFEDDPEDGDADAWSGDPESWDEVTVGRWSAEAEERARRRDAAREAERSSNPRRRMAIDDAITFAQARTDQVLVWLEDQFWDASAAPHGEHPTWPPAHLELRPRWVYEPATAPRADAWWVVLHVNAAGLTPALARAAAERDPAILTIRSVTKRSKRRRRRRGAEFAEPGTKRVDLECLIRATDDKSVVDNDVFFTEVGNVIPRNRQIPLRIRLQRPLDRLLRRERDYSYWSSMSMSPHPLRPATADEIETARGRR